MKTLVRCALAVSALGITIGSAAGCSSNAPAKPAAQPITSAPVPFATAPAPNAAVGCGDLASWISNGGLSDVTAVDTAMSMLDPNGNLTDSQLTALDAALATAANDPAPAGVGDGYNSGIESLVRGDTAYRAGDLATFSTDYLSGAGELTDFVSAASAC